MAILADSFRRLPKATYVTFTNLAATPSGSGNNPPSGNNNASASQKPTAESAVVKFGYLRQLALQRGEVDKAIQIAGAKSTGRLEGSSASPSNLASAADLLRAFEGSPLPSLLPSPATLGTIPALTFADFGDALVAVRKQAVQAAGQGAAKNSTETTDSMVGAALELNQLNTAVTAGKNFNANAVATRIGMLNLERLEMTPAGLERGELIATIPLAPMEQTSVVQKEWSVTSSEFTSVVTDSLENYSEVGVTDNTELSQSTTSQASHDNQFNATGTVQGSFASFVTASAQSGFTSQDKDSKTATDSRKDAVTLTRKASSRSKQSHKVTISTTTTSGSSETSTRTLSNPSATDPMRIDYFSLMRKWHVGLYRYGLRLTYDIVVPEPAAAMRLAMAQIDTLQQQVAAQFVFQMPVESISPDQATLDSLSDQYGASLPYFPEPPPYPMQIGGIGQDGQTMGQNDTIRYTELSFDVPDDLMVEKIAINARLSSLDQYGRALWIVGFSGDDSLIPALVREFNQDLQLADGSYFMAGAQGHHTITFQNVWMAPSAIYFLIYLKPTAAAIFNWQMNVWNACYNAKQAQFYANQQALAAQLAALQDKIHNVDTLTLRREENDEIMKCVLQWLLGSGFDFMPANVRNLFAGHPDSTIEAAVGQKLLPDDYSLTHGVSFTGNSTALSTQGWSTMFQYEQMVRFINDAIEWENVIYYLYSYFWDVPDAWAFIRGIRHPDATRQAFLRSGGARVVLTVRQGFEEAWVRFAEAGQVDAIYSGPYLTIAQQIADYNNTNYPGIPPTSPGGGPLPNDGAQVATTSADNVTATTVPITLTVLSSDGFIAGYTAIIDTYDSGVQEAQTIVAVPDSTHVELQQLSNAHDGTAKPIAVMQAGEKGLLIAEWFEYTPSSGTDIAVTSNLATIA